ncbi:MAG TPA: tyrosinase family protein [Allosphingosinicella sp.]|nr:tyrosinase family protein [Allosphingosinicella sp.]
MAVTRTNILNNTSVRDKFIEGVLRLKREIINPTQQTSTWDAFVIWHQRTMMKMTPPTQSSRNAAHRGPVFLPWHRFMLIALERQFQRVLNDSSFALPYWSWHADGDLTPAKQRQSALWKSNCLGGSGNPVTTGPFAFNANDPNSFRIRVEANSSGNLVLTNRGLRRALGQDIATLPTTARARAAVALATYDEPNWGTASSTTFRNVAEGWQPNGPGLHNRVHVWVGGDMAPGTSPNDPVFYLNHCNADRMWAAWQTKHPSSPYLPPDSAPSSLLGHRLGDRLESMFSGTPPRIRDMLNVSSVYTYDTVADLI